MVAYIARRLIYMVLLVAVLSLVCFLIIQIPPGDYLTTLISQLEAQGTPMAQARVDALRIQYGLDQPIAVQYVKWVSGFFQGNFGFSFQWNQPVAALIGDRLSLTIILAIATMIFTYAVAIPIGIYAATHQYSAGDYTFTFLGFIGLAVPNFLLALILMFVFYKFFGISVGGLFSPEYLRASWSWAKFGNLLLHLPIPIIVIGTANTAGLIRVMRGTLLDELKKQYVVTARAKGNSERRLLLKYPVRLAINPIVSTIGWVLPNTISGSTITAMVLSLPTTGPLLFNALLNQDIYLSATLLLLLSALTVIGTFLSDILLALVDPRIRFEGK